MNVVSGTHTNQAFRLRNFSHSECTSCSLQEDDQLVFKGHLQSQTLFYLQLQNGIVPKADCRLFSKTNFSDLELPRKISQNILGENSPYISCQFDNSKPQCFEQCMSSITLMELVDQSDAEAQKDKNDSFFVGLQFGLQNQTAESKDYCISLINIY